MHRGPLQKPIHKQLDDRRKVRANQHQFDRAGATMVEFAIISNVLFLFILICLEFTQLHLARNLVQDAAYYAARQAMVPGATADEATQEATRILSAMFKEGYQVDVNQLAENSSHVVVTVSVDLHQVALLSPIFLPNTQLSTVAKMRTERYRGYYRHENS